MADTPTVIYAARNMQQAHMLRNQLAEEGIKATVANDMLQGGSGVDIVGWSTLSRVVVAEDDAPRARELALEFDRMAAASAQESPAEEEVNPEEIPQSPDKWPSCPSCHARRTTRCPVCGTAGSDFPAAYRDFSSVLGLGEAASSSTCSCGHGGCTPADQREQPADANEPPAAAQPQNMLLCTTCDEPFAPEYPRRCEWCGHEFADGFSVDVAAKEAGGVEAISARLVVVILAIVAVAAVVGGWLMYLFG
jgi:hypothetical protein